ncbi:AAA family ATPase [Pseudomonas jessenii]|uniref:AAA family ATPase n=1 Tax=Pseudomonas jessenii TaxID=77298 RepID=A0A5C4L3I7_PSEJE|nr:AAA family ATPase [Pseudomonas jessenii]TNB98538.1 AAA family ATPase [Pseudomonas jessenii]
MLPDINFASIRLHRGTQASAFEELCCQLAGEEQLTPGRVRFTRKGQGADGGLECFAQQADGAETGWQVKYFGDMGAAIKSLDESLSRALLTHPKLETFIVCLPFDPADSRKANVKTALERWNEWTAARIALAASEGRSLQIVRWDAFELKKRLTASNSTAPGRVRYWFDQSLLTSEWFRDRFEKARATLGKRYSPESHINLPIRRVIEATALDPRLLGDLKAFSVAIEQALSHTPRGNQAGFVACDAVVQQLRAACDAPLREVPLSSLQLALDGAHRAALVWYSEERDSLPPGVDNPRVSAISNLLSIVASVVREISKPYWDFVSEQALLVVGDAGTGKSHLLADVCDFAIEEGRPAVMILGGSLPDGDPWHEILTSLGLKDIRPSEFLSALNAAGQAVGGRSILMIDALNERNGQEIWPDRLAGLVHEVRGYEWITLVLSCRSSYEESVIPTELGEDELPRVTHKGFTLRQAREYLSKRGVTLAEEPNSVEELLTPLFLSVCCDALVETQESALLPSLGGVTEIFKIYTEAIVSRVNRRAKFSPSRNLPKQAIELIASEMADTAVEVIPVSRAYQLLDALSPPGPTDQDLVFQLENEGLLSSEPIEDDSESGYLRFTFQRMSDHAIASSLLKRSVINKDADTAFRDDSVLTKALTPWSSTFERGVLEALAVQLPEKYGVELNDMSLPGDLWVANAFEKSLLTRNPKSFSERTWDLIEEIGGNTLRYGVLIAGSTDPARTHNSAWLDAELQCLPMPARDASWSRYLAEDRAKSRQLIEWVREADQTAIRTERAELTGIQLCWFLTASHRAVRDTATKALVTLLTSRAGLAMKLWTRFKKLDDAYVTERLVAAIYGAAMQSVWQDHQLSDVVGVLHNDVFVDFAIPANALTRDHARGLVRFAKARGALPDKCDISVAEPPYTSPWPIEYVTEAELDSYECTYRPGVTGSDQIVLSAVSDGDFARYQLDSAILGWSPATKGVVHLPTATELAQEWLCRFRSQATNEKLAAFQTLTNVLNAASEGVSWEHREAVSAAKHAFRVAVGEDVYAEWKAEASPWRQDIMCQGIRERSDEPTCFNLSWARGWVCKRAHGLGWSEDLHGEFDLTIRNDRNDHTVERIGKKYQWIALYELCARMSDNLAPLPRENSESEISRLRNIDPSLLLVRTEDDGWRRFEQPCFWIPQNLSFKGIALTDALFWLDLNTDIMDDPENIEVINPVDDKQWLVLKGFESWRGGNDVLERESWRRVGCFVIKKVDLERTLAALKGVHLQTDDDIPTARSGGHGAYLGEHPWANRVDGGEDEEGWISNWSQARRIGGLKIRATTAAYLAEATDYDNSLGVSVDLSLPAGWLMRDLGLRLTDGSTIQYVDQDGHVRFMDPSVSMTGRSAALIDRGAFLSYLEREELVAVWALSGEKGIYGKTSEGGFGGRWTFTRIFHSQGNEIIALERYQTTEKPNLTQLALMEMAENEVENDWT